MDKLIQAISSLDTHAIERVSFYKDTTAFVNGVKEEVPTSFLGVATTGHSLVSGCVFLHVISVLLQIK